ncbi:Hypothetical protein, putative [Bodo saltans]|uniref:Uncharacterized protein n=1 Tax=Bodo saltans TaxID=75058 RepID=A0A0S4KGS4_BODSA|nr:Hypothetical protein, putative [Bodo saltans]|eukprot:CUI14310.1 Hypothetical protein, putative [Bodo saltans]
MSSVVSSVDRLAFRVRLERMYKKYDPSRVHHVDALLAKFERHEGDMMKALVQKYGPEPDPDDTNIQVVPCRERFKKRIYNFYKFYNPAKLGMVDDVADGYWQSGEAEIMSNLIAKYGPEPMVHTDGTVRTAPKRHRGLAVSQIDAPRAPSLPQSEERTDNESSSRTTSSPTTVQENAIAADDAKSSSSREGSPIAAESSPSPTSKSAMLKKLEEMETDMEDIEAFLKGATVMATVEEKAVVNKANRDQLL